MPDTQAATESARRQRVLLVYASTHGHTENYDYTDWGAVDRFAHECSALLGGSWPRRSSSQPVVLHDPDPGVSRWRPRGATPSLGPVTASGESVVWPPQPVVVGVDERPQGRDALALGAAVAKALEVGLVVASVYPTEFGLKPRRGDEHRAKAEYTAAEALEGLAYAGDAEWQVVAGRSPAHGLHDLAESLRAAAVVIGSSHRGALGRVLVGNVATQLLSGGPCPVLVAPLGLADLGPLALQRIGVGFDDSGESWHALERAASLAAATGGSVRVIHALRPLTIPPSAPLSPVETELELRRLAELATGRALASLSKAVSPESRLVPGDPVRVLEAEAQRDLDLLVLGSRAFGPVRRVLLGSVSSEVVRLAPCPVMVVPRSAEPAPSAAAPVAADASEPVTS